MVVQVARRVVGRREWEQVEEWKVWEGEGEGYGEGRRGRGVEWRGEARKWDGEGGGVGCGGSKGLGRVGGWIGVGRGGGGERDKGGWDQTGRGRVGMGGWRVGEGWCRGGWKIGMGCGQERRG